MCMLCTTAYIHCVCIFESFDRFSKLRFLSMNFEDEAKVGGSLKIYAFVYCEGKSLAIINLS